MISICIPVYNFNITSLIDELSKQANVLEVPYEIICIDDASEKKWQKQNASIADKTVYIELPKNIGRAKIRNLFLQYARFQNLLFLDCDSIIRNEKFLFNYVQLISKNKNYNVVCGGRIYNKVSPPKQYKLRWLYGIKRESLPVEERIKNPNASFQTNNFLINKNILSQTGFDERITEYGHEDTLFGFALKQKHILVYHINNPVVNGHLENNKIYLQQTEKAVVNLIQILRFVNYDKAFITHVSLLNFYYKSKTLQPLIAAVFSVSKPLIKWLLVNGYVSLSLFNFYKLGTLIKNIDKNKQ